MLVYQFLSVFLSFSAVCLLSEKTQVNFGTSVPFTSRFWMFIEEHQRRLFFEIPHKIWDTQFRRDAHTWMHMIRANRARSNLGFLVTTQRLDHISHVIIYHFVQFFRRNFGINTRWYRLSLCSMLNSNCPLDASCVLSFACSTLITRRLLFPHTRYAFFQSPRHSWGIEFFIHPSFHQLLGTTFIWSKASSFHREVRSSV